jgi:hypothetical protein
MATSLEGLKGIIQSMEDDYDKFMKGNNAAGTRVRKALMEVRKYADQMRKDIQDIKNERSGD